MPRLTFVMSFVLAVAVISPTPGQDRQPSTLSAEEVKAEIRRVEGEIAKLRQSPEAPAAWKEIRVIESQLKALRESRAKEQEPLQAKLSELAGTREVQVWDDRLYELTRRLRSLNLEDYKLTQDAGRRLFQSRHDELARLAPAETPRLHELRLDVLTYPRMDGSTSTQPLAALIACRCFGSTYAWQGREQTLPRTSRLDPTLPRNDLDLFFEQEVLRREPELTLLEFTLRAQADRPAAKRLAAIINGLLAANASTHQTYVNLIEGTSDIGLLARRPSTDELTLARMKGVLLDVEPCALDAFVFMVNVKNGVRDLSTAELRDIYAGQTKSWKSVGGHAAEITAYQREENSGSQELMRSLVMKGTPLETPTGEFHYPPQLVGHLMSSTFLELTGDEAGIGYSVYYYERYMSGSPRTRVIAVDSVEPSAETIASKKYPFVSEVFVVTRTDLTADAPARRLRDWLLSAEGQAVVRESGYVPLARER